MTLTALLNTLFAWLTQPATPCRGLLCLLQDAGDGAAGLLYLLSALVLSVYGFNALLMTGLFLWRRRAAGGEWPATGRTDPAPVKPPSSPDWPQVTVQLPVYNEMFVIERLIDAACALDYPADRLTIQVLDDSTDNTQTLARARVAFHAARGADIRYVARADRRGYKAGALAAGLADAPGEFIGIFDADFVPPANFLKRLMPHFDRPDIGAVQARWGHLNAEYSPITRAQALLLDGHFVVEQVARSRSGLFLNFNGSAGVWRRACIEDSGGWSADTVAEDLDLSYRAQLRGWNIRYLPELVAPAEIPQQVMAHKRQQFRWATGSIQCLRKHAGQVLRAPISPWKRLQGLMHLGAYLVHPAMLVLVLTSLPVTLKGTVHDLPLGVLGLAGFGAPIMFAVSQWAAYRGDWLRRFAYFIYIVFLGSGLTLNNTWAVVQGLSGRSAEFKRTPKFRVEGRQPNGKVDVYAVPVDWTTWGEALLALYTTAGAIVAFDRAPGLAPFLCMYAISFGFTAATAWWQSIGRYPSSRNFSRKSSAPPLIR